jgi:hypothetical protein
MVSSVTVFACESHFLTTYGIPSSALAVMENTASMPAIANSDNRILSHFPDLFIWLPPVLFLVLFN